MTFFSLRVLEYPNDASTDEGGGICIDDLQVLQDLDLYATVERFGPYRTKRWADQHGLETHFVDTAWLRVPVSGDQLLAFLDEALPRHAPSPEIRREGRYLIDSWEC